MLGASTVEMAIAVSNSGGLGSFAASGLNAQEMAAAIAKIRSGTNRAFLVNLFAIGPANPSAAEVEAGIERLRPWRERYGLPPQIAPKAFAQDFDSQFEVLLQTAPPAVSFTFGCLDAAQISALKQRGCMVIGTATTLAEARVWAANGADAICAQGFEAGGHRGTFLAPVADSLVGTMSLTRTIAASLNLPVIAAGGISDGPAIAAALALGASAVQIGTAYLLANEALTSAPWRAAIANAGDDATRLTRAISGRFARGIENEFMREMRPVEQDVPAYPVQNALTQELRAAAAKAGSSDVLSLWAGQSVQMAKTGGSARDITLRLWAQAQQTIETTASIMRERQPL